MPKSWLARADDTDQEAALELSHRALRDEHDAVLDIHLAAHLAVLAARIAEPSFQRLVGSDLRTKMDGIRRQGNRAAHSARRLSAKFNWAQLDVTRRSIEETAAAILKLFTDRQRQRLAQ